MSVILRPDFPVPPRIPLAGANHDDIARAEERVGVVFDLALSAIQGQVAAIRENVPIPHVESFYDLDEAMKELKFAYMKRLRSMNR